MLSQVYPTVKILIFTNSKFAERSFHSEENYLRELKNNFNNSELFYNDTKMIKLNNKDNKKTLNNKKSCN